jgi:hypothetical protein
MIGREDYKVTKKIHKGTTTKAREVQVLEVCTALSLCLCVSGSLQEADIDSTISFALHCLFRHERYLPRDPYKTILNILRRKERIGGE